MFTIPNNAVVADNTVVINNVAFKVTDDIAKAIYELCVGAVPTAPVAPTPVVAEQHKAYKASRNITEAGFDFEVVAENGGIVAKGAGGKYLPNTLRKVCNYHIRLAGFTWDGTDKCYKGGDSSKIDTHITQEEYNRYADKVDNRNKNKYGA